MNLAAKLALRTLVVIQITDRQNVDIQVVARKCRNYIHINLP
jgi:hypothetical protein